MSVVADCGISAPRRTDVPWRVQRGARISSIESSSCPIVLALLLVPACSDLRQSAVVGSGDGCSIEFRKLVELEGDEVDHGGLAVIHGTTILLRRSFAPYELAVFDVAGETGRYIRTIGEFGTGPGEFKVIDQAVPQPAGGWALFDSRNLRVTYLDSTFNTIDTHPIPAANLYGAVEHDSGGFVLSGAIVDRDRFGSVAVHMDRQGHPLRYFGADETEKANTPLRGRVIPRLLAFHTRHGVATMKTVVNYQLELWKSDGSLRFVHTPSVDWYTWPPTHPGGQFREGGPVGPPEDHFKALQFDSAGNLWIVAQITPDNWQAGVKGRQVTDREQWADDMIEVLDVDRRQALCNFTLDRPSLRGGFAGPGVLTSYYEDEQGRPKITFWKLSLNRQSLLSERSAPRPN